MKRATKLLIINALTVLSISTLIGCNKKQNECDQCGPCPSNEYLDEEAYEDKIVDIYREANKVDKQFLLRFYANTPNVPYVNVKEYYKEFFAHDDYLLTRDDFIYQLSVGEDAFIRMDAKNDILTLKYPDTFSSHKESIQTNGLRPIKEAGFTLSGYVDKVIPLYDYNIDIHANKANVYMPLSLLSIFSGGSWFYSVTYNGKDIYVLDYSGILTSGVSRVPNYYGDSYFAPLRDLTKERGKDLAEFTYGQLCLTFDHFRGYTSQLFFGDNNLVSIGTDGMLEQYYPGIKKLLLSQNKLEYYAGYNMLITGMFDGGHTTSLMPESYIDPETSEQIAYEWNVEYATDVGDEYANEIDFLQKAAQNTLFNQIRRLGFQSGKVNAVEEYTQSTVNYYRYEEDTKTAIIGFDSFTFDNEAWDAFYRNNKTPDQAPVDTDAYAFIRSKFYQAKADGAKNLLLDISTNGGGNTGALLSIMGLFNKGKAYMGMDYTENKTRAFNYVDVDINLDGKFDQADVDEASTFDFNFGVLTSKCSFSCGNLLPSLLKELGIKIIGEQSGGGSCSIVSTSTADGMFFAHSSPHCLANRDGDNIDSGVPVDKEMPITTTYIQGIIPMPIVTEFYNFTEIGEYLSTAYSGE